MKLSIAVVCTVVVALIAATAMVDANPALVRRGPKNPAKCKECINECEGVPKPSMKEKCNKPGRCKAECA
ncbi:hypothetical protein BDF19DRAFT_453325 [Syncephalis fuscata]|nr:hypothetical protein BDF19DRAFT_453325 [Syncephalis fuscata]